MKNMNKQILILHSGGLDSTLLYEYAKTLPNVDVRAVYFNIGHDYAWKEIAALPKDVIVHDLSWFQASGHGKDGNAMNNIFIPGRNMLFVTLAACKYLPDEIWLGALMGEIHAHATDKNERFRDMENDFLQYVLSPFKPVKLVYPCVDNRMGKFELTEWGVRNGFSDLILKSSSCMSGEHGHCGKCGVCLRRAGIFMQLGLSEEYNVDPWTAPENIEMIKQLLKAELNNDNSHYDAYRREEIIPALCMKHPNKTLEEILNYYDKI